jgi:hypothetical protein
MTGQIGSILDVAIVLAALFVVLSCVCSFVNEQIAALLSLRGQKLFVGVLNLVGGAAPLAEAIFAHPLIDASSNDKAGIYRKNAANRPSYVDARNFSMAFWQSLIAGKAAALPGGVPAAQAATAATAVVTEPKAFLDALRQSAQVVPNDSLRASVSSLLISAGDDYEKLLKATDAWFNAQMDRVSGWYRRQTQYVLIGIAALVVIGTGLDSIEVGKHLYATPIALSAAAASIQGAFPNGQADPAKLQAAYTTVLAGENMQQFLHPLFADFGSHYPGMFATLIALSLGTPFWFDALGKLVNVRMTGAKPASTPPSSAT